MQSPRQPTLPGAKQRLISRAPRTRSVVAATALLVICVAPFANARTGDNLREGVRNGTATAETQIVANLNASTTTTGGYATRQSNLSSSGGGAIYGCRSAAGGSAASPPQNPCLRANNLSTGYAFEFNATRGDIGGLISAGAGGDSKRPFITNATGVAVGLNADRLDGLHASEILAAAAADATAKANAAKSRWLLVNAAGQIEAQSGGFTIAQAYSGPPAGAVANVYINAGEDLSAKGIQTTIALQNQTNQVTPDPGTPPNGLRAGVGDNPEFSGEITATRCAIPQVVVCAPEGTNNANHFVVSPRLSDGQPTTADNRKRFYVTISG